MRETDKILKQHVPYYGQMKKALPASPREKKTKTGKKKEYRLTAWSQSGSKAVLKDGVSVNQAARKLYAYEEIGLTPQEILNLMERERNLTIRVEKLEGWRNNE